MPFIAVATALGAATVWSAAALISHRPASRLGAFELTRIQLITSAWLLVLAVSLMGLWETVSWGHWPALMVSALVAVLLGNLADFACMRRGGPRRMQLLHTLNAPMAAGLGLVWLGEAPTIMVLLGCLVTLVGIALAIVFGADRKNPLSFEAVRGPYWVMLSFGLAGALCQAVGLIALKPVLEAGTDPLAASALRTGGAAFVIMLIALWPSRIFRSLEEVTPRLLVQVILPGFMGYVLAVSLLLYALSLYETGVVAVLGSLTPVIMLPMIWVRTGKCPPLAAWMGAGLAVVGVALILQG